MQGNAGHVLDNLTRLIVLATRSNGTGTWAATLDLHRKVAGATEISFAFNVPLQTASPVASVVDAPFAFGAFKVEGTELIADEIFANIEVTPGEAAVASVAVIAMLVPGFVNASSDKGANVSVAPYLRVA